MLANKNETWAQRRLTQKTGPSYRVYFSAWQIIALTTKSGPSSMLNEDMEPPSGHGNKTKRHLYRIARRALNSTLVVFEGIC